MPAFTDQIGKLLQTEIPGELILLIHVAVGIIMLFFGLKVIRFWLGITGLAGGAFVGTLLVEALKLEQPVNWVVIALMACAGAAVLALAYKACFFVGGFIAGLYYGNYLLSIFFSDYKSYWVWALSLGLALVALFLRYKFTMIITAVTGAFLIADAVVCLLYKTHPGDLLFRLQRMKLELKLTEDLIILLCMAVLAAAGVFVQMKQKKSRLLE